MAESVERVLTLRFQPDLSQVDAALTAMEQRASRPITFGSGGSGAPTFSAEGPAIGGGAPPTAGGSPGGSPGTGGFRPAQSNADSERLWSIRQRTALVGLDPGQRLQFWQGQSSSFDPGSIGRARADEQIARAEQAIARAKEREAKAAERSAAAEERRSAAAQKASAREYAADDRAYQREFKGRRSAMADAMKAEGGAGPKSDLDAIAEAAGQAGEDEESPGRGSARAGRGGGRRFNPGRGLYRFLGPYFIAQEALRVANANIEYRDESSIARTGEEELAATTKYNQSLLAIPIAGQGYNLYRNLTGKNREQMLADRRLEEAKRDDAAGTGDFQSRLESRTRADTLYRSAATARLPAEVDRQQQAVRDQYDDWREQESARIEGLRRAIHDADLTPEEAARRRQTYRTSLANFDREDTARRASGIATVAAIERDVRQRREDLGLAEPELHARLEGQVGVARERALEAGLRLRENEAERYDPRVAEDVRRQNNERRRIASDDIVEGIRERDESSDVGRALISHRPQRASDIRFEEERRIARREAGSNPDDLRSRLDNIAVRERQDAQERNDRNYAFSAGTRARNDELSFQLGDTTDPRGIAALRGAARGTLNNTLLSALSAAQNGQAGAIPDILKGGQLQLQLQRRNYIQGFSPEEADPRRQIVTGEGAANPASALKDIADGIKTLKGVAPTLDEIKNTINRRLGVAL